MIADIELRSAPAGRGRAREVRFAPSSFSTPVRRGSAANRVTKGRRRAAGARMTSGEAVAPVAIRAGRAHPPRGQAAPPPTSSDEDFLLRLYFRDALNTPLLEPEEELQLGRRAHRGDPMARERLVLANLRLVVRIAFEYQGFGLAVADLISEGNLGLMRAVELFNPDLGARLAPYAAAWIKQRIRRALSNQSRLVRLPLGLVECAARVRNAEARLHAELGRAPTDAELAEDVELVHFVIHRLRGHASQVYLPLDAPAIPGSEEDEEAPTLGEALADPDNDPPDEALASKSDRLYVDSLLNTLEPREQQILRLRFGLDHGGGRSLEQVGQSLGVVRQRVQQIEAAALLKLRKRARLSMLAR